MFSVPWIAICVILFVFFFLTRNSRGNVHAVASGMILAVCLASFIYIMLTKFVIGDPLDKSFLISFGISPVIGFLLAKLTKHLTSPRPGSIEIFQVVSHEIRRKHPIKRNHQEHSSEDQTPWAVMEALQRLERRHKSGDAGEIKGAVAELARNIRLYEANNGKQVMHLPYDFEQLDPEVRARTLKEFTDRFTNEAFV